MVDGDATIVSNNDQQAITDAERFSNGQML
jgi:hypothetical protein